MTKQTLSQQFYDLKAEVLKKMRPGTYVYLYVNPQSGSGITLGDDDMIMEKFSMMGTPPVPCDSDALIDAYKTHVKRQLSGDEYLEMAIARFKEIIIELDKQKNI